MIVEVDIDGTLNGLKNILNKVVLNKNVKSLMILSADANGFNSSEVDSILKEVDIPIFGGIFPQVIYKKENLEKGSIVLGLDVDANVQVIEDLSSKDDCLEDEIMNKFAIEEDIGTMFVFVDAFATSIASLVEELFNVFGLEHNYIGGGAGSLSFVQKPCLFTNNGLLQDSALLVSTTLNSGIGIKHGWKMLKGPFQITKSNKNIIEELDYKPAFKVYKKVVEKHSKKVFNNENFFDIAKAYPFGISKLDNEKVVRDPIATEDNKLICVGEVDEGNYIDILHGSKETLVKAAKDAYDLSKKNNSNIDNAEITFFIDCISRVLYLEDEFQEELSVIPHSKRTTIGALTLGEIANSGYDYLEFYNKTAVIGIF